MKFKHKLLAGSESLGKIFTPEKLSRHSSASNIGLAASSNMINASPLESVESTLASLETAVSDSQAKCLALAAEVSSPDYHAKQQPLADVEELTQKLESMRTLLTRLRNQI